MMMVAGNRKFRWWHLIGREYSNSAVDLIIYIWCYCNNYLYHDEYRSQEPDGSADDMIYTYEYVMWYNSDE